MLSPQWLYTYICICIKKTTQEPDFSQTCCFCKKLKDNRHFRTENNFLNPPSPSEIFSKNLDLSLILLYVQLHRKKSEKNLTIQRSCIADR